MEPTGAKRKRQTYEPPTELGRYLHHPVQKEYVGYPDGSIWSKKSGAFIQGSLNGEYVLINLGDKNVYRHRFIFEIANQRVIQPLMHVDHINADKTDNSWTNLQELTSQAHAMKTSADNPKRGAKCGVTLGQKLVATHIGTGEKLSFNSQWHAARELGLHQSNIGKQLRGKLKRVGQYTFEVASAYMDQQRDLPGEQWEDVPKDLAVEYGFQPGIMKGIRISNLGRIQDKMGRRTFGLEVPSKFPGDCYMSTFVGSSVQGQGIISCNIASGEKKRFASQSQAAKELGLFQSNISLCLKGKLASTEGYTFEKDADYENDQADLPGEEWRKIPEDVGIAQGFSSKMLAGMQFSSAGRVRDKRGRRTFGTDLGSHKVVKVADGPLSKKARVHVLCTLAFHGPPPGKDHIVQHINGENSDNSRENLTWVHKTAPSDRRGTVKAVQKIDRESGAVLATYQSIMEAAEANNIAHRNQISDVIAGRKATAGGYGWQFAD
ncbi:hypothetical protein KFL_007020070 [Klebsormidium nitens]|uniref:HNH endonuclease n=1 Tax=Klebsormidium nitens TaxID=105231 RepID=A0A1Y1IJ86_KLENI|nr:hypothetical protein KFL_007020070 [Klebsormidium nitens]|eukprot:GAQ90920.1 hypothetical protein KFL_007020070 [Klebsormidium nitens]